MGDNKTQDHGEGVSELYPRPGSDILSDSPSDGGFFGYLFKGKDKCEPTLDEVVMLSKTMIGEDAGELPLAADDPQENPDIPAGYTFLGQFIDHDITFEATSYVDRRNDVGTTCNLRTPAFDLDSVYGAGPDDPVDRDCYASDPKLGRVLLICGPMIGGGDIVINDLARAHGKALVPDRRNDENRIVSQVHAAFIAFHNRMIEVLSERTPGLSDKILFEQARRETVWHYQWIVLWDYLARVSGGTDDIHSCLGKRRGDPPNLPNFGKAAPVYMPVEVSAAVFRFAHSMIRPAYLLNRQVVGARVLRQKPAFGRIPVFHPDMSDTLEGNRPPLPQWSIEWNYFFPFATFPKRLMPGVDGDKSPTWTMRLPGPQLSYRIDHELSPPLCYIPDPRPKGHGTVKQTLDPGDQLPELIGTRLMKLLLLEDLAANDPQAIASLPWESLSFLDLMRGRALGLPSGQWVARELGAKELNPSEIQIPNATKDKCVPDSLLTNTPLFFYVLREAAMREDGRRLGEVGRKVLTEVIVGLLWHDMKSFLRAQPSWRPWVQGADTEKFTMSHFLKFAYPMLPDPI